MSLSGKNVKVSSRGRRARSEEVVREAVSPRVIIIGSGLAFWTDLRSVEVNISAGIHGWIAPTVRAACGRVLILQAVVVVAE